MEGTFLSSKQVVWGINIWKWDKAIEGGELASRAFAHGVNGTTVNVPSMSLHRFKLAAFVPAAQVVPLITACAKEVLTF